MRSLQCNEKAAFHRNLSAGSLAGRNGLIAVIVFKNCFTVIERNRRR